MQKPIKPVMDCWKTIDELLAEQREAKKARRNAARQEMARLRCRVRRSPASLAGYHYHLEAGHLVYVLSRYSGRATVATMPKENCVSEDYFTVANLDLLPDIDA